MASLVIPVIGRYPITATVLSVVFLAESLRGMQAVSVALAVTLRGIGSR